MTEKILCNPCRWAEVKVDEKTERDAIITRGMELTGPYMKLASEKVKKNAWVVSAVGDSDPSWQGYEFGIVRASGSLIKLPSRVVQHGAANLEALTLAFKGQYTDRHTRDGTTSNEHFVLWRDPSRATASHPTFWFAAANVRQVFETWGPETVGGLVTGEVTIWRLHDRQKTALAKVPLRLEPRAVTAAPAADAAASTSESETVAASSGQHPVGSLVLVAIKHYGLWPAEVAAPYSPKVGSSVHKARGRNTILLKTFGDHMFLWTTAAKLQVFEMAMAEQTLKSTSGGSPIGAKRVAYREAIEAARSKTVADTSGRAAQRASGSKRARRG